MGVVYVYGRCECVKVSPYLETDQTNYWCVELPLSQLSERVVLGTPSYRLS